MATNKTKGLKDIILFALSLILILGIVYMILVTIGIYANALNYKVEPFYTAYLTFNNFDKTLTSLRVSLYLFYVFFVLTLIAPIVVFFKELKRDKGKLMNGREA